MKKIINTLLLILLLNGLEACKSDFDPLEDGNHRFQRQKEKPMIKTISMSFGGDYITESEEPLLRAEDGDTYAAVNVWRTEKNNANAKEEKYAYGLFKNKDEISIDVVTGFEYRMEATIVTEYVDKIEALNGEYINPFNIHPTERLEFENPSSYDGKLNDFVYSSSIEGNPIENSERYCFCQLSNGAAYVNTGKDYGGGTTILRHPRVKRFYGTLAVFDPAINNKAEIKMDYKSFGLEVKVETLPSGYVTIKDKTSYKDSDMTNPLLFTKDLQLTTETGWSGIFSMNNLKSETETFTLEFTWNKGGGVTESFTKQITVKPKTKKILKLNISGDPNYQTNGNIILVKESTDLAEEEEVVNYQK